MLLTPAGSVVQANLCDCVKVCEECHGSRFLFTRNARGQEEARPCGCETRRLRVRLYNQAGVPARFVNAQLTESQRDPGNFHAFNTFNLMAKNFTRGQKGILLMGRAGVGKTHLMAAFIREIIFHHGVGVIFQDFSGLLKQLRSTYARGEPEEALIDPLNQVDVLMVDELGKGRNSEWELTVLDMLISHRYNARKTTLFTTNYTDRADTTLSERVRGKDRIEEEKVIRDTLTDRVGTRIHSRLKEMCDFVMLEGVDRREREAVGG
ncbi:MAG: ATP-binding protein [Deltaproteobacteria bacterium]|nr:ATP-binding protein [Deltaproteobacteria bacterium]